MPVPNISILAKIYFVQRQLFFLLVLLVIIALFPVFAEADDLIIPDTGDIHLPTGEYSFETVLIAYGGSLTLDGPTTLTCERLDISGSLFIAGDTSIIVNYGKRFPESSEYAMRINATNGGIRQVRDYSAADGADGVYGRCFGSRGSDGMAGYDLDITVYGHLFFEGMAGIYLEGQNGGEGGEANPNYDEQSCDGGAGGDGGNGGNLTVIVSGKITSETGSGKFWPWRTDGGDGGSGGNGYVMYDGVGAVGGRGGKGGRAGKITIIASQVEVGGENLAYNWMKGIRAAGGDAGESGSSGGKNPIFGAVGGPGILGAPGGNGGDVLLQTTCDIAPPENATLGFQVIGGTGGNGGWANLAGGSNNITGVGGKGGTITIIGAGIDRIHVRARGGDGGGGSWGNPAGAGAAGGNGGEILIRGNSLGDTFVKDFAGGSGGPGGLIADGSGTFADSGPSGGDGSYSYEFRGADDVNVFLSATPDNVQSGEYFDYRVAVSTGTAKTGVVVRLPEPAHTMSYSFDPGATIYVPSEYVEWNVGYLNACETHIFTFRVAVTEAAQPGEEIVNQATVTYNGGTPITSNEVRTTIFTEREPVRIPTLLGGDTDTQKAPDPVHTGIGNYYFQKSFFRMPGKTMGVDVSVTYNSLDLDYAGPLGNGWTHSYNIFLTADTVAQEIEIKWGDGHSDFFSIDGGGVYTPKECNTETRLTDDSPDGWIATLVNGNQYEFDAEGKLTGIIDLQGNQIGLAYNVDGQLTTLTDQAGRAVVYAYDASGKLTSVSGPESISVGFDVNAAGDLARITDPRGNHYDFSYYDTSHRLQVLNNRRGIDALTLTYYPDSRVESQTIQGGAVTLFTYDDAERTTQLTPPSGNGVTHSYDAQYNQVAVTDAAGGQADFTFALNGKRTSARDKMNSSVAFQYDSAGNISQYTDRLGNSISSTYSSRNLALTTTDALGKTTSMAYDANGNLLSVTDPLSNVSTMAYNGANQLTSSTNARNYTTSFIYNGNGLLDTVRNELGDEIKYTYDDLGRVIRVDYPSSIASNKQVAYDANGNVTRRTNRAGTLITSTYNENDQVLTHTLDPGGIAATTTYTYNGLNQVTKVTGPTGSETVYTYDANGNIKTITDPDGVTITKNYDVRNRLISVVDEGGNTISFTYDANGNILSVTDALNRVTEFEYDLEQRCTKTTDPTGAEVTYAYDAAGRIAAATNPLGRVTSFAYDDLGRRTVTTLPDGSTIGYEYDGVGNLTRVIDQRGHYWQMEYDELNRLVGRTDPAGQQETMEYDAMDNMTSFTDREGRVTSYIYDLSDRLIQKSLPVPSLETQSFSYDAGGRITQVGDDDGKTSYTYDAAGRRLTLTDTQGKVISYTYTNAGKIKTMTYPGSRTLSYAYNNIGMLASITDWNSNVSTLTYDAAGQLIRVDLPNGSHSEYTYSLAGLISGITHKKSDGSIIASYAFIRNSVGQIIQENSSGVRNEVAASSETTFSVDAANRTLTMEKDGVTANYVFDKNGNLNSRQVGGVTTTYGYDVNNRLIQVADGSHTTGYGYDALGNRIAKTYDGTKIKYLRDGSNIYLTYNQNGTVLGYHVHGPGGMLYSTDGAGGLMVYYADLRGSVVAVGDNAETIIGDYAYDPYGRIAGSSGGLANPYMYAGIHGVARDENGLYHMLHRYYDPELMRFINEDPLGLSGGLNQYSYADGDPIGRIDPQGLASVDPVSEATKAQRLVMAATGDAQKAADAYDLVYKYVKTGTPYEIVDGVINPLATSTVPPRPDLNIKPLEVNHSVSVKNIRDNHPGYYKNTDASKPSADFLETVNNTRENYVGKQQRPPCGELDINSLPQELRMLYYEVPGQPTGIKYKVVNRFSFALEKAGIALENLILKYLGTTGLRTIGVVVVGGTVVVTIGDAIFTGFLIADIGRATGFLVYDQYSGTWMTLDEWGAMIADQIITGDYVDMGIDYYRNLAGIELNAFRDEIHAGLFPPSY